MGAFNELKNAIVCLSLILYINVCVSQRERERETAYISDISISSKEL